MNKQAAFELVESALERGQSALSEYEAKQVLAAYDIPTSREILVKNRQEIDSAVSQIGFPLVMKGCSDQLAHKTEKNLIRVDLRTHDEAVRAFEEIHGQMESRVGEGVLVQEMVSGKRELVVGMTRDPQFGPCVMFGLGGIFTEILKDIAFRKAPIDEDEAVRMMYEIKGHRILEAIRGMEAADTQTLADVLVNVGQIGIDMDNVAEIDINPVILDGSRPVAVDALIVLTRDKE